MAGAVVLLDATLAARALAVGGTGRGLLGRRNAAHGRGSRSVVLLLLLGRRHALPGHRSGNGTRRVVRALRLRNAGHLRPSSRPGGTGLLLDDHDGPSLGGVETRGVDAGEDEEDEVVDPEEPGEGGAGDEDGVAAGGLVAVVVLAVALAVVVPVAVVAAPVAVVDVSRYGDGRGEAADDGGREPDDEGEADMGARVDALLEGVDGARDELGAAPEEADGGLGNVSMRAACRGRRRDIRGWCS